MEEEEGNKIVEEEEVEGKYNLKKGIEAVMKKLEHC